MKTGKALFGALLAGIAASAILFSCNDDEVAIDPAKQAQDISEYITGLSYDPNEILDVQNIAGGSLKKALDTTTNPSMVNNNLTVCTEVKYNLKQNAEQVAIIRPTNGVIWPGALVKVNAGLLNGMPEPVTLKQAATTLRVDLPGLGAKGTVTVAQPSNSNTQTSIDEVLDWWNNNQYVEGYVNPSNSSYNAATSFSSEQLALDMGLNVKWASGSVSTQFSQTSSSSQKVAMMTFKQVFYTVTMDTPPQPGAVFDPSVNLSTVKSTFSNATPPGYVHSVSYGRIIMFRMVTTESATATEVEGAMKYSTGVTNASATLEAKYKSILQNSTIEVVTIGGDAEAASEAVTAQNFGDLKPILTGKNAVYSKNNPGVPIAYTVKFLMDNKVAKMGYTTDYTATECTVSKLGRIRVKCSGWYVMRFTVDYKTWDNVPQHYYSGDITAGNYKICEVPGGSTDIRVHAYTVSCATIFDKAYSAPVDKCFVTTDTVCFPDYSEVDCGF
jgi:thiol-activated cytolysin